MGSGRRVHGDADDARGAAPARPTRKATTASKLGSGGLSARRAEGENAMGGRRRRIEAAKRAMARNDELRRQREQEETDG